MSDENVRAPGIKFSAALYQSDASTGFRLLIAVDFKGRTLLVLLVAAIQHADVNFVTAVFEAAGGKSDPKDRRAITLDIERFLGAWNWRPGTLSFDVVVKNPEFCLDCAAIVRNLSDRINLVAGFKALRFVLTLFVSAHFQTADVGSSSSAGQDHRDQQPERKDHVPSILTHHRVSSF